MTWLFIPSVILFVLGAILLRKGFSTKHWTNSATLMAWSMAVATLLVCAAILLAFALAYSQGG